jgi:hypothetical protein
MMQRQVLKGNMGPVLPIFAREYLCPKVKSKRITRTDPVIIVTKLDNNGRYEHEKPEKENEKIR